MHIHHAIKISCSPVVVACYDRKNNGGWYFSTTKKKGFFFLALRRAATAAEWVYLKISEFLKQ
jgi:hypothetical protein